MRKKAGGLLSVLLVTAVLMVGCGGADGVKERERTAASGASTEIQKKEGKAMNLKDAFEKDFKVGVAVNPYQLKIDDSAKLICDNFNSITMENAMKPEGLLDQRASEESEDDMPEIQKENLDEVLSLAKERGLPVRGHCLVWHNQTPEWFFCKDFEAGNDKVDKATLKKRMESYIRKVLTYCQEKYPEVVYAWDVVNEACDDGGGYRTSGNWYEIYGDESYIVDAFTFARKYAADDVKLFYNDYNEYMPNKVSTIAELLRTLYNKKLVDGMGFQSHWDMNYPDVRLIEEAMAEYSAIGDLEIQFTEIDMHNTDGSEDGLKEQADRYKEFFQAIVKADRQGTAKVTGVTFWGLDDDVSWLPGFKGEDSYPLLFDGEHRKKPCYDSIQETGLTSRQQLVE